ncbi:MAG: hypothetical protein AVDCRST_MAG64-3501, partial [uncultured Phycisphaerae bacterium]
EPELVAPLRRRARRAGGDRRVGAGRAGGVGLVPQPRPRDALARVRVPRRVRGGGARLRRGERPGDHDHLVGVLRVRQGGRRGAAAGRAAELRGVPVGGGQGRHEGDVVGGADRRRRAADREQPAARRPAATVVRGAGPARAAGVRRGGAVGGRARRRRVPRRVRAGERGLPRHAPPRPVAAAPVHGGLRHAPRRLRRRRARHGHRRRPRHPRPAARRRRRARLSRRRSPEV